MDLPLPPPRCCHPPCCSILAHAISLSKISANSAFVFLLSPRRYTRGTAADPGFAYPSGRHEQSLISPYRSLTAIDQRVSPSTLAKFRIGQAVLQYRVYIIQAGCKKDRLPNIGIPLPNDHIGKPSARVQRRKSNYNVLCIAPYHSGGSRPPQVPRKTAGTELRLHGSGVNVRWLAMKLSVIALLARLLKVARRIAGAKQWAVMGLEVTRSNFDPTQGSKATLQSRASVIEMAPQHFELLPSRRGC